jgi:hypothetical protein
MSSFHAKISFIPGAAHPDEYRPTLARVPPKDFVVTRNKDGSVLSKYGDLQWDRTPYHTRAKTCNLYFVYWIKPQQKKSAISSARKNLGLPQITDCFTSVRAEIVSELQWLMFILIYFYKGKPLGNGSLESYLGLFHVLGRIAETHGQKVSEVLSSPLLLGQVKDSQKNTLIPFLKLLRELGPELVGFDVVDRAEVKKMAALSRKWKDGYKQTPPIPTTIYSQILVGISDELEEFEAHADKILALYRACVDDPQIGENQAAQSEARAEIEVQCQDRERLSFSELLQAHGLEKFWQKRGYPKTILSVTTVMLEAFYCAARQIQAFSGMRRNELEELPHDCLREIWRNEDGKIHFVIQGRVTKLHKGQIKQVRWVTSHSGRKAILLAQKFSRSIYAAATITHKDGKNTKPLYLFVSPRFGLRKNGLHHTVYFNKLYKCSGNYQLPLIGEKDLRELDFIDSDRHWRAEEAFKVGRPWPLSGHQMRRSLALYSQASGLVSLSTLKRQLHHITREMSLFYSKGSQFAIDFIGADNGSKHIGKEWQEAQPVSQFLAYAAHVLMANPEDLFGTHSHFLETRLRNEDGIVQFDRTATLRRFQKGEMAYRDTLLGGCTEVGRCDKNPLDLFNVECIKKHCKSMVGSKGKLDAAIKAQSSFVAKLKLEDETTPEYRHEKANLGVLLDVQNERFPEKVS